MSTINPAFAAIMPDIQAWLTANDIRPANVPIEEIPAVAGGRIRVKAVLRADGRGVLTNCGAPILVEINAPLLVPAPPTLNDWLAGRVPVYTPDLGGGKPR